MTPGCPPRHSGHLSPRPEFAPDLGLLLASIRQPPSGLQPDGQRFRLVAAACGYSRLVTTEHAGLSDFGSKSREELNPHRVLTNEKPRICRAFPDSGGGIRTRDLRVMSPTSYQTAPPRGGLSSLAKGQRSDRPRRPLRGPPPGAQPIYHPRPCASRSSISARTPPAC
jgi:hypothetical protein